MSSTLFSTTGVVLARASYREDDRLYVFFSSELGKLRVIARGARKPKAKIAPHLESYALVRVLLVETRGFYTVAGADTEASFHHLFTRDDSAHLAFASAHLVDLVTREGDPASPVYHELMHWWKFLETTPALSVRRSGVMLGAFSLRLAGHAGYLPELNRCLHCRTPIRPSYFEWSSTRGGVVCLDCLERHQEMWLRTQALKNETLKLLRMSHHYPYEALLQTSVSADVCEEFHQTVDALILAHFPVIPVVPIQAMCQVDPAGFFR
ncbi:MAG: repair protein RecO protein [Parcubacteria group bacterium GW2011_GWA2_56_7]|nr:MAG: repair protein RecO protein [Parcubacteria group bacterium GW2011_GWA2_56_7]